RILVKPRVRRREVNPHPKMVPTHGAPTSRASDVVHAMRGIPCAQQLETILLWTAGAPLYRWPVEDTSRSTANSHIFACLNNYSSKCNSVGACLRLRSTKQHRARYELELDELLFDPSCSTR
ncbi:unnamed protein product, partial [Ectocarpus sp. 12 AP-2014]